MKWKWKVKNDYGKDWICRSVVQCLSSMLKALGSIQSSTKKIRGKSSRNQWKAKTGNICITEIPILSKNSITEKSMYLICIQKHFEIREKAVTIWSNLTKSVGLKSSLGMQAYLYDGWEQTQLPVPGAQLSRKGRVDLPNIRVVD